MITILNRYQKRIRKSFLQVLKKSVLIKYINDTFGMAKDLVKTGASLEIVALILDLSEETIAELKKEING